MQYKADPSSTDTLTPEQLWQQAAARLRSSLPRTDFETWLRDLEPVSFSPPELLLRTANSFGRDWILSKYTSEMLAALASVDPACQSFRLLLPEEEGPGSSTPHTQPEAAPVQTPAHHAAADTVTLQPRYLNAYDETVRPERIIAFPAYYLRWIPYLGVDLAWLPIGFRQVAFLRGLEYRSGSTFQASGREIARWSGMGQRTFWRRVKDPLLRWFIQPIEEQSFSIGEDGRPHREPSRWQVVLSMPLTPQDQQALRSWLINQRSRGLPPAHILDNALQLAPDLLLPPSPEALPEDCGGEPRSVQQVVQEVLSTEDPEGQRSLSSLADSLAAHLLGSPLLLSHYFVLHWLPLLGAGPGWMVTLLRSLNPNNAAAESEFEVPNGYPELASRLGIQDPWRIARWLRGQGQGAAHLRFFLEEIESRKQSNQQVSRAFWITRMDPPTPADRQTLDAARVSGSLSSEGPRVSGSNRDSAPRGSGRIEPDPVRDSDTIGQGGPRGSGNHVQQAPRVSGTGERGADRDSGTGYSGGFNPESTQAQLSFLETTTSINPADSADTQTDWSWENLLVRARVAHPRALQLRRSQPQLFLSWLLYAASARGSSLRDPIGHAVSRLLEDPDHGAGPAFEELASLGPEALGTLILRQLRSGDARWAHPAWGQVMQDASSDRLQQLAELIGLDWRDAGVPLW